MKSTCLDTTILLVLAASACADTPAFRLNGTGNYPPSSFTGTLGWSFNRDGYGGNVYVTQLGLFDNNGDGFTAAHQVGLWHMMWDHGSLTGGVLLASATIPAGTSAPLVEGYRWVSIEPTWIPANLDYYMVGGEVIAGGQDETITPGTTARLFAPQINPNTYFGYFAAGSDMPFPVNNNRPSDPEYPFGHPFWWANFQFSSIPEPASWQFVGTGLLLLLLRRRSIG